MFDPGSDEQSSNETTIAGDGETGVAASPSVAIELSGSHDNADGSTTEWSNSTEVGTNVDLKAAIGTTTTLTDFGMDSE